MRNGWLVGLMVGACWVGQAWAQGEQWLQYRWSRMGEADYGGGSYQKLELVGVRPAGVGLPEFKSSEPLFAKWTSPLARNGYLWLALDRSRKNGPYDRLYIDANDDGQLSDEPAITPFESSRDYSQFGPVRVVFAGEEGPITYHLNVDCQRSGPERRDLYARSAGWYEGQITVAGAGKKCVLIDYNVNGTFNDKSSSGAVADRIVVGKEKGPTASAFVGNFLEVEGKLYRPEIARDGAFVKIAPASDVAFGAVRLPEGIGEFTAVGENGLFRRQPEGGITRLPVGQYAPYGWASQKKDIPGKKWKLEGSRFREGAGVFQVGAGLEASVTVGEPVKSVLAVQHRGKTHLFSQRLEGKYGESIDLTCGGNRPPAPRLHIKNRDGSYDRAFSFEYG